MAGSATITGTQHYVLGIGHPKLDALTENAPETQESIVSLSATRSSTSADSGVTLSNSTASNYTVTIDANTITHATMLQQESTGTITVAAGAGVTFIGASLATSAAGGLLSILPTSIANTFIVKLSS